MTGKFTQHVHNIGYFLGRSLHSKITRLYNGNGLEPVANTTKFSWITKLLISDIESSACSSDNTSTAIASILHSTLTAVTSLPQLYKTWWLNLLENDRPAYLPH